MNAWTGEFLGWQLTPTGYGALQPNAHGWLWSHKLGLWLGAWQGEYLQNNTTWLRFYDAEGHLVLIEGEAERERASAEYERAEAERERANVERARAIRAETVHQLEAERRAEAEQRASEAEAELARLRARLRELGIDTHQSGE